jgi:hypothetical protein
MWLSDDADDGLHVFVPGLMVTGILVSMGMLISDGVKKVAPSRGHRARAIAIEKKVRGRIADLTSVGLGVAPAAARIDRVPRRRRKSALLAAVASAISVAIVSMTIDVYEDSMGTLDHRGWTLTAGFLIAAIPAALGIAWLAGALYKSERPEWLRRLQGMWPIGELPDLTKDRG